MVLCWVDGSSVKMAPLFGLTLVSAQHWMRFLTISGLRLGYLKKKRKKKDPAAGQPGITPPPYESIPLVVVGMSFFGLPNSLYHFVGFAVTTSHQGAQIVCQGCWVPLMVHMKGQIVQWHMSGQLSDHRKQLHVRTVCAW